MFFLGNPSGHDFEFHLQSWMEVLGQWKQGIIYPRWAALAHYGYGEARFFFYPPGSWLLGALLGAVLPWSFVPGVYIWIVLTAAGYSMLLLARGWLPRSDAIFAAALYAANPYHLVIVYWRSAFAELLASILLPLLLHFILRLGREGKGAILSLALVVAAAWLTDAPAAVIVNYSLALLIVVVTIVERSPRRLLAGAAALALGAALAAFYLLPAAYEQKWVDIGQVLSPGVRPQDNFLFTTINDPDHNRFNRLISIVAIAEFVSLAAVVWLAHRSRRVATNLWWSLIAWAAISTLLMFPMTLHLWEYLPKLRYVQLPWRWLLCTNVPFALLVTWATRRWISRIIVCLLMLFVLALVWHKEQTPWWDTAADINEIADQFEEATGYEGTDEYVPKGAGPDQIRQNAPRVAVEDGGRVRIHIQQWAPEAKFLTAQVRESVTLVLKLFNYPSWRVQVNDRLIQPATNSVTGQMTIPLDPGENRIRVTLVKTWDRTAGVAISLIAAILTLVSAVNVRRRISGTPSSTMLSAQG